LSEDGGDRRKSGGGIGRFEHIDADQPLSMRIARVDAVHEIAARDADTGEHAVIEIRRRAIHELETTVANALAQRVHLGSA
jgi:hypothetical protein